MTDSIEVPDLMAEARLSLLEALAAEGPLTLPEMPRRWPVTRPLLTFLVRELVRAGLVARVPGGRIPGARGYALTPAGRAAATSGGADALRFPRLDATDRVTA